MPDLDNGTQAQNADFATGTSADLMQAAADKILGASRERTIRSGIARVQQAAEKAAPILKELGLLVGDMTGEQQAAGLSGTGSTQSSGTSGALHDAVSLLESFVQQVGPLVARARAAHG